MLTLKWLAVWTAFIGNHPMEIVDIDGPHRFATAQECFAHIDKTVEPLNRILRSYTANLDTMLLGDCVEEGVDE